MVGGRADKTKDLRHLNWVMKVTVASRKMLTLLTKKSDAESVGEQRLKSGR
jgi:hypothetical protein